MISKIPVWVPAILILLVFLGYRQSRTRLITPKTAIVIAVIMLGLSLSGVANAFGLSPIALSCWLLGIGAPAALGFKTISPAGMSSALPSGAVRVPGSWLPMGLMLGIFFVKFGLGFAAGLNSPLLGQLWFGGAASLLLGLLSGGFVARALAIRRFSLGAEKQAEQFEIAR